MYAYSKTEKKHIDGLQLVEHNDRDGSLFSDLINGRYYDLFSLFGSMRGCYEQMPGGNDFMPDFLVGTSFEHVMKDFGYYGFVWYDLPTLKDELQKYRTKLQDPELYYTEDDDDYLGSLREEHPDDYKERWAQENEPLTAAIDGILKNLKVYDEVKDATGEHDYYAVFNRELDIDKTIFLFYFDS